MFFLVFHFVCQSITAIWHYWPKPTCTLGQRTERLCGRLQPLITLQNKKTKTNHPVQNTKESAHQDSPLSRVDCGCFQWHHLRGAWSTPALGPQQGLCLLGDAMVTRCDSSVSFQHMQTIPGICGSRCADAPQFCTQQIFKHRTTLEIT